MVQTLINKVPFIAKLVFALIGAVTLMSLSLLFDELTNRFAPISYWVDVQEIVVSDIDLSNAEQSIIIKRKVKRELNGYPRQELYLVGSEDAGVEILQTPPPLIPADYEPNNRDEQVMNDNFWARKGVDEKLKELIEPGELYRWVWVIEFIRPNGKTEIERYSSNEFTGFYPDE